MYILLEQLKGFLRVVYERVVDAIISAVTELSVLSPPAVVDFLQKKNKAKKKGKKKKNILNERK